MLTAEYDSEAGLIRCMSEGFLTIADVEQFAAKSQHVVALSRRQYGYIRVLFRKTDTAVQSTEVVEALARQRWPMADPRDRVALIVTSPLAKLQAARTFRSEHDRAFTSEAEALAWLTLDHPTPAAMRERLYG